MCTSLQAGNSKTVSYTCLSDPQVASDVAVEVIEPVLWGILQIKVIRQIESVCFHSECRHQFNPGDQHGETGSECLYLVTDSSGGLRAQFPHPLAPERGQVDNLARLAVKNPVLVKWLLDHGAAPDLPNDRGVTPLGTCAIHKLSPEIEQTIDLLLACGADISKDKRILHMAIRPTASGGVAMLKHLLSRGADPSYEDPDTGTPLHYAASLGMMEEAKVLAETDGVDVRAIVDGCTAADVARSRGYDEVAEMLDNVGKGEDAGALTSF